jgi:hypothetical protein
MSTATATEPLDADADDRYGLDDPIADSADGLTDRYTENGEPVSAYEANGRYLAKRSGEDTMARENGLTNNTEKRANRRFRLLCEGDRRIVDKWHGDDNELTTALLSLRLSPSLCEKRVEQLKESIDALDRVIRKLRYDLRDSTTGPQLDSDQFSYAYVISRTDDYATIHIHLMVYVNERVDRDTFTGAADTWVDKCDYTPSDGRGNRIEEDTISVRHNDNIELTNDGRTTGMKYTAKQMPHIGSLEQLDNLLFYSTMDAYSHTGVGTAQSWPITMSEVKSKFDIRL